MLSWSNFWKGDPILFRKIMQMSTEYVAEKLCANGLIDQNTRLLDFGCGPGYLARALQGQLKSYAGVDISPVYIETAREKMGQNPNTRFQLLSSDSHSEGFLHKELAGEKFDVIIILSVIQYFKDKAAVQALLQNCLSVLSPNGKIILADVICSDKNLWKDVGSVLVHSFKKRYFFSFLRFMARIKMSAYNTLRKEQKLLHLSVAEVREISKDLGVKVSILPRITLQSSRISYSFAY